VFKVERKFDLLIFDLDGTLIDNRVAIRNNFNHALRINGQPELSHDQIDRTIGRSLSEVFEELLPIGSEIKTEDLLRSFRTNYRQTNHIGLELLDGVPDILEKLKRAGFKLAISTTKADEEVHLLLKKIALYDYFDLVTGFTKELRTKPHPDMLDYIMRKLDIRPQRTAMIGDTYLDIEAAKNAHTHSIVVLSGVKLGIASLDLLRNSNPDIIISSLRDLPKQVLAPRRRLSWL
jgi:phosphoglycolate phosphatase